MLRLTDLKKLLFILFVEAEEHEKDKDMKWRNIELSYMIAAACLCMALDYFFPLYFFLPVLDCYFLLIKNNLMPRIVFTYCIYADIKVWFC